MNQGDAGITLDDITVTASGVSAQAWGNSVATLQRPDGTSLPQITVPSTSVTFDAAGTTTTFPLGVLSANSACHGTLNLQISDGSGIWTTTTVAVDDSVGPWLDSARIAPNPLGNSTDSVYFWTSEPISTGAPWSFLVDRLGSATGSASTTVPVTVSPAAYSSNEFLALLPAGQLRNGDSLRLNPATTSDLLGNPDLACHRDVPLSILSKTSVGPGSPGPAQIPVQVDVRTIPFMEDTGNGSRPGSPVQIWVRRKGDVSWFRTDGSSVSDTGHLVGAVVTANTPLVGTAYFYDNSGVFAIAGNLAEVSAMASQTRLPTDSSGTYQIKIGWDGRLEGGVLASSGIYVVRLVLLYRTPETPKTKVVNKVFRVGVKRTTE